MPPSASSKNRADTAEWALLVECVRPNPGEERLRDLLRSSLDWPFFLELAEEHGVPGLAANRLQNRNIAQIPDEVLHALRDRLRAQTLFSLRMVAEMFRLFEAFSASGLECAVVKGPVLSVRCYGDPGLRQYGDLDLVARDADMLRFTELMIGLGYEPTVPLAAIRAKKAPGEYAFRQSNTQLLVEIHTERTFRYHPKPIPLEELFRRQVCVKVDARDTPALSLEDELVLICIHGAKHFWEQLSYISDVASFLANQSVDWRILGEAADQVGARRMLHVGLQLAADVLGAVLPGQVETELRSDRQANLLAKQVARWLPAAGCAPPGILERAAFRARMHGKRLAGVAYVSRLLFSPTEDDWLQGEEHKRSWLLDAAGRPFRLARKYGRDGKP